VRPRFGSIDNSPSSRQSRGADPGKKDEVHQVDIVDFGKPSGGAPLNVAFSVGAFLLLYRLLQALALDQSVVFGILLLFSMNSAMTRFIYYYPIHTEPGAIYFSLGVLMLAIRRPDWGWVVRWSAGHAGD